MNIFLLLLIAVSLATIGHWLKMRRWKLFIEIYEEPNPKEALQALTIGQIINFFIPFRIGDFVRAILAGRKLKNGIGFVLATIIIEHYIDILAVGFIFFILSFGLIGSTEHLKSALFYVLLSCILLLLSLGVVCCSGTCKKAAKKVSSLFNAHIEFSLLFFFWSAITAFKDIIHKLSKKNLIFTTFTMWGCYLVSYYVIVLSIVQMGSAMTFADIFFLLFSRNSLGIATMYIPVLHSMNRQIQFLFVFYIMLPLLILLLISFLPNSYWKKIYCFRARNIDNHSALVWILPQITESSRLNFLEQYFSNQNKDYLKKYIEINRNIRIIDDFSAGSNATTLLCMNEQSTFYRKYAFGKDGNKLYEQLKWIRQYQNDIPLPQIIMEQKSQDFCSYDMVYDSAAVDLFQKIHSDNTDHVWHIIETALEHLEEGLYTKYIYSASPSALEQYISTKVLANLEKIKKAKEIKPLLAYNEIWINGKKYKNIKYLEKYLTFDYLNDIFKGDMYSVIHGDLTVENIICWEDRREPPYYFIDPNTGNIHESPMLDYAKLLQSLHGGYEFLMQTQEVEVKENHINFLFTCSQNYNDIFCRYRNYLSKKYSREQVRSIFFHEVVHWLRLLPYKIEKNGKRAVLFYAGFLQVFNDITEWYVEKNITAESERKKIDG